MFDNLAAHGAMLLLIGFILLTIFEVVCGVACVLGFPLRILRATFRKGPSRKQEWHLIGLDMLILLVVLASVAGLALLPRYYNLGALGLLAVAVPIERRRSRLAAGAPHRDCPD